MVWRSTQESVEKNQVSIFALIEMVGAVVLSFWIASSVVHSWKSAIVASFIAPFLFLRTELSTERGLRWYVASLDWIAGITDWFSDLVEDKIRIRFIASVLSNIP